MLALLLLLLLLLLILMIVTMIIDKLIRLHFVRLDSLNRDELNDGIGDGLHSSVITMMLESTLAYGSYRYVAEVRVVVERAWTALQLTDH
jgi:hypothetical protein